MNSIEMQQLLYKTMESISAEQIKNTPYLYIIEGKITELEKLGNGYFFEYQSEEYVGFSITGEQFNIGDLVYVLFSNNKNIKKMILSKVKNFAGNDIRVVLDDTEKVVAKLKIENGKIIAEVSGIQKEIGTIQTEAVKKVTQYFAVNDSPITTPITGWSTTVPKWEQGKYIWQKSVITYIKGREVETEPFCLTGSKGDSGIPGKPGLDGKTTYFHVKYSKNPNPKPEDLTEIPSTYIGTYVDFIQEDSTDPKKYTWSKFQGEDGIPGTNGADGKTSYLHIKYSDDNGNSFTSNNGETPGKYLGQYVDFNRSDSPNLKDYTWSLIKGKDGINGIDGHDGKDGLPGKDGVSSYTHIAYANSSDGKLDFSTTNSDRKYVGMYVDLIQQDSEDYTKYKWTLIKGADGKNGIPGTNGVDGRTPYLHIAYATSQDGSQGFSTTDSIGKTHLGQYTDYIEADSTDYRKYTWSLIKGKGIQKIIPQYYISSSKTDLVGGQWKDNQDDWVEGKYIWTRTYIVYDDGTTETSLPILASDSNGILNSISTLKEQTSNLNIELQSITSKVSEVEKTVTTVDGKVSETINKVNTVEQKLTSTSLTTIISEGLNGIDSISTTKFIMDRDGFHVKGGGIDISNNFGTKVFYADTDGNLILNGKVTATTGKIGCWDIKEDELSTYDKKWEDGQSTGMYIGSSGISISDSFQVSRLGYLKASGVEITGTVSGSTIKGGRIEGSIIDTSYVRISEGKNITIIDSEGFNTTYFVCKGDCQINGFLNVGKELSCSVIQLHRSVGDSIKAVIDYNLSSVRVEHFGTDAKVQLISRNNKYQVGVELAPVSNNSSNTAYFRARDDGWTTLGTTAFRWYRYYGANSDYVSSDERLKTNIQKVSNYVAPLVNLDFINNNDLTSNNLFENIFNNLIPKTYYMKDDKKGKVHIGFIAQDIVEALGKLNCGENDLDLINHEVYIDEKTKEQKDSYALAYEEFIALNTYMIQKCLKRIEALEKQNIINKKGENNI